MKQQQSQSYAQTLSLWKMKQAAPQKLMHKDFTMHWNVKHPEKYKIKIENKSRNRLLSLKLIYIDPQYSRPALIKLSPTFEACKNKCAQQEQQQ